MENKQDLEIQWPQRYAPENSPIHVRNELDMAAAPETVWTWLVAATRWPSWYVNAADVRIIGGPGPNLNVGTQFCWKTFGVVITSTVLECVRNERIAWNAHAVGLDVYHAWVLQPANEGCKVVTEETQHGWLARLSQLAMPKRMYKYHQIWLEALADQASTGLPPSI